MARWGQHYDKVLLRQMQAGLQDKLIADYTGVGWELEILGQ